MANDFFHVSNWEEALDYIFVVGKFPGFGDGDYFPKLILLDIDMPKSKGIEILQGIRADARTKRIPIVILTSSKAHPDIQK